MKRETVLLSEPIRGDHFRYKDVIRDAEVTKDGITRATHYMSIGHCFTHIDAPCHIVPNGKTLKDCDIYSFLIGKAAILDVSPIAPSQPITKEMLEKAYEGCESHDFLIIKTCWGQQRDSYTPEFWSEAPYLTEEGTEYLRTLEPKVVGYDFPQDYGIRNAGKIPMAFDNSPTHYILLANDILMIEYMNNLWKVPGKNVDICAMPLNIDVEGADGAPITVVAIL